MTALFTALLAWFLVAPVHAQDYTFPTSSEDYGHFYPTAYKDHGGRDWNCGGNRYSGHRGSDFGAGGFAGMDAGRDIVAAAAGTVTRRNDGEFDRCTSGACSGGGGFGNYVYIRHANGRTTIYAHLKRGSVRPNVGDVVQCNQKIGEVGSSGSSTGPHVHFEVRNSGNVAEDPFDGPCSGPPTYWRSQGPYNGRPGRSCPSTGSCHPVGSLSCGQSFSAANNGSGSRNEVVSYGCSQFQNTGPEKSWTFRTPVSERVTITMTGLSADIDLFVTSSSSCNGSNCVVGSNNGNSSNESVTFNATGGHTYTVVADGWAGAVSNFTLAAHCTGGVPEYRAQLVSLTGFPSGRWTMAPGQVVTGTVRLKNTGRATWANNNVRIATTGPRDRSSVFRHSSWIGANRIGGNGGAVAPNATKDYTVRMQAPMTEGSHREQFGLVAEGITWFAQQGGPADNMIVWDIDVVDPTPDYRAELVSVTGFPSGTWTLEPGQVVSGTVVVRNTGRRSWTADNVRLGTTGPRDRASVLQHPSWISERRIAGNPTVTNPGDTATYAVTVQAPPNEVSLVEGFGLVAEGITWFANQGGPADDMIEWDIVVAEPYKAELVRVDGLPQPGLANLLPGEPVSGTVTVRNAGTATWGLGEVELAATGPRDRASELAHTDWLSSARVAANTSVIAPGQEWVVPVTLDVPETEASYTEAFGLALSDGRWFADEGGPSDDMIAWDVVVMERYRLELVSLIGAPASGPWTLELGQEVAVELLIRNTGFEMWNVDNLRLGTSGPRDSTSPLFHPTWLNATRVAYNPVDVATGEVTTLVFTLEAPHNPGRYNASFEMVLDPGVWFADHGGPPGHVLEWDLSVVEPGPAYAAQFVSLDQMPEGSWNAAPGDVISGYLTVLNVGTATWVPGDVHLATTEPRNRVSALVNEAWPGPNRLAHNTAMVEPGSSLTLPVTLRAPERAGVWRESFGLVSDTAGWFADNGGPGDGLVVWDVTVLDSDVGTDSDTDAGTEPDTDVDTESDTDPGSDAEADTEPELRDSGVDDTGGPGVSAGIRACGCASSPGAPAPWAVGALLALAVIRNRRRQAVAHTVLRRPEMTS